MVFLWLEMSGSPFSTLQKQRRKTGSSIEDEARGSPGPGPKDSNCYTSYLSLQPRADRSGQGQHTLWPCRSPPRQLSTQQQVLHPDASRQGGVNAASTGKMALPPSPPQPPTPQTSYHQHQFPPRQDGDTLKLVAANK